MDTLYDTSARIMRLSSNWLSPLQHRYRSSVLTTCCAYHAPIDYFADEETAAVREGASGLEQTVSALTALSTPLLSSGGATLTTQELYDQIRKMLREAMS